MTVQLDDNQWLSLLRQTPGSVARSADALVDSIGVGTHLPYLDTVYATHFDDIIRPRLRELGVRHVRDGIGGWDTGPRLRSELVADGIDLLMVVDPQYYTSSSALAAAKAEPLSGVVAWEAGNELDIRPGAYYAGQGWPGGALAWKADVTAVFGADAATAKIPVIMGAPANSANLLALSPISTVFGNLHPYAGPTFPSNGLDNNLANLLHVTASPVIASEYGYHTDQTTAGFAGVSQLAQAKYAGRAVFEFFNRGFLCAYVYELINLGTDPTQTEQNWGLLNNDGSAKPAFTTLKNIIALLSDRGPAFAHKFVRYTLSGAGVHSTVLDKRDGRVFIALWQEVSSFNSSTQADLAVPTAPVDIVLGDKWATARVHVPRTGIVSSVSNPISVHVDVPDEVLIVELVP